MASIAFASAKTKVNSRLIAISAAAASLTAGALVYSQNNGSSFASFNSSNNKNSNKNNNNNEKLLFAGAPLALFAASNDKKEHSKADYQKVYNSVAELIQEYDSYDEGIGFGPALVRLAWHQSGTYTPSAAGCPVNKVKHEDGSLGVGGSFGGTMRYPKEGSDGANNGLQNPRWLVEKVHKKFPWISYGDLYTLSGVCAVQEMGGPKVGWRSGRKDLGPEYQQTNKLPDASRDANYVRDLFANMGFNDREVVSLIGAHALGSCHVKAPGLPNEDGEEGPSTGPGSGYIGRWTASPNFFTNEFFRLLLEDEWHFKKWDGPKQYIDKDDLMMLPTDMALVQDSKYKKIVEAYAKDQDLYFKDFAKDFQKLLELGIDFGNKETWYFKTLEEQ